MREIASENISKKIGSYSAVLSLTEVGLGSLLHAFHIPLTGHFLSLNQGFILIHANKNHEHHSTTISNVAAILKSLSPAGKRLTPMLAISAQGYLFSVGVLLLGSNPAGYFLGMTLLSLWAFLQPVLIYLFVFGGGLIASYQFLLENLNKQLRIKPEYLLALLLGGVAIKIFLAWAIVGATYLISDKKQQEWLRRVEGAGIKSSQKLEQKSGLSKGIKSLFQPFFLISLAVTVMFFWFSENKGAPTFWIVARPVAVMFLIHFGFQFLPVEVWAKKLTLNSSSTFACGLAFAISVLKNPLRRVPLKAVRQC